MAQLVKYPTLDVGLDHALVIVGSSSALGSVLCGACLRFSLPLSLLLHRVYAFSFKIINFKKKKER